MSTWNEYVLEAKGLVRRMKNDRLQIARLALLASKLPGTDTSVTRFAKDIGIETQTLQKWIRAYDEYRLKNPVKEPEPGDFSKATKEAEAKHRANNAARREAGEKVQGKAEGRAPVHITIKIRSFLGDVNKLKDRLKLKNEVKQIGEGERKELIVKLKEIVNMLEKA